MKRVFSLFPTRFLRILRNLRLAFSKTDYQRLPIYAATRAKQLAPMLAPYIEITDRYGELLCELSALLGEDEPSTLQDAVVRDLMADVFDFLYESRVFILRGQTLLAFPLARRAY